MTQPIDWKVTGLVARTQWAVSTTEQEEPTQLVPNSRVGDPAGLYIRYVTGVTWLHRKEGGWRGKRMEESSFPLARRALWGDQHKKEMRGQLKQKLLLLLFIYSY